MATIREMALSAAVAGKASDSTYNEILRGAELFAEFLEGSIVKGDTGAKEKPKRDRPAKVEAPAPEKAEEKQVPAGPTVDDVKAKVNELLEANKRKEALDLFAHFKAKNASALAQADYEAFIKAADDILLTG